MDTNKQSHCKDTNLCNQHEQVGPLNLKWYEILMWYMNNSVLSFQFQYNLYLYDPLKMKTAYEFLPLSCLQLKEDNIDDVSYCIL